MNAVSPITAGALLSSAREAPCVDLASLTGNMPLLILAPHPDDESLGCGGLIAACCEAGIPIAVALLTDGAGSHPGSLTHPPAVLSRLRVAEMQEALKHLGLQRMALHELGWPDERAPSRGKDFERAVAQIVDLLDMLGAHAIVAAWGHDPHCDHEAAAAIAAAAARIAHTRHLAYPVWGWTLPADALVSAGPPLRLPIERHLPAKRRAVASHRSQHGLVITDVPNAFTLPAHLLEACLTEHEVFFEEPVA